MKKIIRSIALVAVFNFSQAQIITTFAGNGTSGYTGDGGQATAAEFNNPYGVAIDAVGNLYISDDGNNIIRKINTAGIITTVAGGGSIFGDGGQATAAELNHPASVVCDAFGNLYIVDFGDNRIRKINTGGIISTIAGNGIPGYSGDGGQATAAELYGSTGIAVDAAGNLYIADTDNGRIRKVNTAGIISTFAGNGTGGYSGDGGQATGAELYYPYGVAIDATGNVYIADYANYRVRKVNTAGIISTFAGNGGTGYSGDGGQATVAELSPSGVVLDAASNLYITDRENNVIRKVNAAGIISTITGNGTQGFSGDGGMANAAELYSPAGVVFNVSGNLYIADAGNNRIRKITCLPTITVNSGTICAEQSFTMAPTGASTYTFSSGTAIVTPTANATYTVTGTSSLGCVSPTIAISAVMVNPLPTVIVNSGTVCVGSSFTITPSGANTYTYSSGNAVVTLTANSTYSVTGTNTVTGCVNSAISTIAVNTLPTITINSGTICAGQSFTINPSSATASSYTYSSGSAIVTPSTTVNYTVRGTDGNGCVGSNFDTVTVHALPIITVNNGTICVGNADTLIASGASTYTWSANASSSTTTSVAVTPTVNTTYSVTGTDVNGCIGSSPAISTVIVNTLPTLTITVQSFSICQGKTDTLTASGAVSYTWSPGSNHILTQYAVHPFNTTTYTLTGIDANGCMNTATQLITVNPRPTLTVNSGTVCVGSSFTITPSGANTYTYSSGTSVVTPTANATYSVTGTNIVTGCISASVVSSVTVTSCTTGFDEFTGKEQTTIYPNPASSELNISGLSSNTHITIINALGELVKSTDSKGEPIVNINVQDLMQGIYFVIVDSNRYYKFIKE